MEYSISIFKSVFAFLFVGVKSVGLSAQSGTQSRVKQLPVARETMFSELETQEKDAELVFLASIAHLSEEEQQKQIEHRQWYKRMAERQAICEAEYYAQAYRHPTHEDRWHMFPQG